MRISSLSDNTNFGKLFVEPHAMKYMFRGVKHNISNNTSLPASIRSVSVTSGNHCIVNIDNKYINLLEQIFKTVIEKTQVTMRKYTDFEVTIKKGIGDAIKITTSKDIIPKGEEFGHSIILKKPAQYANAEYVAKIVEELHEMNENPSYISPIISKLVKVKE